MNSSIDFLCPKCQTPTRISQEIDFVSFGCSECHSVFIKDRNNKLERAKDLHYTHHDVILAVGAKANFNNIRYEVIGVIIKKTGGFCYWREYTLKSLTTDDYVYLSESNGHWILLEEDTSLTGMDNQEMTYVAPDNTAYDKYGTTSAEIAGVYGFFDIKIPYQNVKALEYINPPYIVSRENINGVFKYYKGVHITGSDIKKAFGISNVPYKSGVGIVQPYYFNLYQTAIIFCVTLLLVLLTHKVMNLERSDKEVLNKVLAFSEFKDKEYLSPSFSLQGTSAPLRIDLSTPISNSWAYAGVSVVNEDTNEEIFAEKDIEYYSGVEGGESWSEGSPDENFYICGLGPGRYHLSITLSKEELNYNTNAISVKARWESASNWNFGFIVIAMMIIFGLIALGNRLFEKSRWSDSDYSPYDTDTY